MAELLDRAQSYPCRAIAALLKLDGGNRMVDRCRVYLEHFSSALDARGKFCLPVPSISLACCSS